MAKLMDAGFADIVAGRTHLPIRDSILGINLHSETRLKHG